MPATYTLIASNTLSSSAASVTFSAIPAIYTDLVLRWSARNTSSGENAQIRFNSDSATNYSRTNLYGDGSAANSIRGTSESYFYFGFSIDGSSRTANTFASAELYIPNYAASTNKPISGFSTLETNAAACDTPAAIAALWRNTAALTSIVIEPVTNTFASGSSFFLYGIKNS